MTKNKGHVLHHHGGGDTGYPVGDRTVILRAGASDAEYSMETLGVQQRIKQHSLEQSG